MAGLPCRSGRLARCSHSVSSRRTERSMMRIVGEAAFRLAPTPPVCPSAIRVNMVVRIGSTTFDNVTRAMQSLCENNVLGIEANGARTSELYSKYTYYYSKSE